jgi:Mg2+ and Co2+ transporter CorA
LVTLSDRLNATFPELSQLIRIYSRTISDVRIAGALADKAAELYGMVPELTRYTVIFTNQIQEAHRRVSSGIEDLPTIDVKERGSLATKLDVIRDLIRDMKSSSPDDAQGIKRILDNISTQYSDTEAILSGLLNRILSNLDPRS